MTQACAARRAGDGLPSRPPRCGRPCLRDLSPRLTSRTLPPPLRFPAQRLVKKLVARLDVVVLMCKKSFEDAGDLSNLLAGPASWGLLERALTHLPSSVRIVIARCNERNSEVISAFRSEARLRAATV